MSRYLILSITLTIPILTIAQNQAVELGDIHWLRSYEEALAQSEQTGKPVLILFQEIPGCATCKNYGSNVLTHPLLVEAAETEFIPLAIYNNKGGEDARILKKYDEPSWNNPVVRIVNSDGDDIVARVNGNYTSAGLAGAMQNALIRVHGRCPVYLGLLASELLAEQGGLKKATYSMYCFWTGEKQFGKLNGVIRTTAGFQNGREVVAVEYDPEVISRSALDDIAQSQSCHIESGGSFREDNEPKYYLSNSRYKSIPMTELQKCRVNSALGEKQSPDEFLSPRQLALLKAGSNANYVEMSLTEAWKKVKA